MDLYKNLNNQEQANSIQEQTRVIRDQNTSPVVKSLRNMTPEERKNLPDAAPSFDEVMQKRQSDINAFSQKYNSGIEVSPEQYDFFTQMLAKSDDIERDESKMAQALLYSRNYGFNPQYAMENLDALNAARLGSNTYDIAGVKKLRNSFKVGDLTVDRGRLAEKYYWATMNGKDTSELDAQIQQLDTEIESLLEYAPKTWVGKLLGLSAQTIPYSWHVFTKAAAGGLIGSAIAPGVGTVMGIAGSFSEGYRLTKYSQYYDLVKAGIDPTVANWTSTLSGVVQAAIESIPAFSVETRLGLAVTGGAKQLSEKVIERAIANGTMGKIALLASQYLVNAAAEGGEEFLQQITEDLTDNIAYELSGMDAPNTPRDVIHNAVESYIGGAGAALVLGLVEVRTNNKQIMKYSEDLKQDAVKTDSKESFINKHVADDQFNDVIGDVSESVKKETLSKIWETNHSAASTMTEAEAKTIAVDFDINEDFVPGDIDSDGKEVEAQPSERGEVVRMDNGRLRVQESERYTENSDGTESHTLNIGSKGSKTNFGYVDYTINEETRTVTIDQVATKVGYENLTRDAILEVERSHEGWNIEWNPETEAQIKVKEQLIKDSPNKTLQWFDNGTDVETTIKVGNWIRNNFKNLTKEQSVVAARLIEFTAQAQGVDTNTWINDHIQNLDNFNEAGKKGAVQFDDKDLKAIIYAGENADFSTFSHETFHTLIRTSQSASKLSSALKEAAETDQFKKYINTHQQIVKMNSDEVLAAIKDMGEDPLKWTRAQHEVAATLFESYLRDGKTFSEKLKNIFTQIADWFKRIYQSLKGEGKLNDNIVKAYDEILTGKSEQYSTIEEAQAGYEEAIKKNGVKIEEGTVRMNVSSVTDLYKLAEEAAPEFKETIENLAKKLGIENVSFRKNLKKFDRTIAKAVDDYKGDIGRVIDINGATFTFNTKEDAREAVSLIEKELGNKLVRKKDKPGQDGYGDIKLSIKTSNGFIGELILLDEDTQWMKKEGIGHDIYEESRKLSPYFDAKDNKDKEYEALFGDSLYENISELRDSLFEWSRKAYENAGKIRIGQYDNEGFTANFKAVASSIIGLESTLRENIDTSYSEGLSSITLPSEVALSTYSSQVESSLLKAVSQISKYLTDIEQSSNSNNTQNLETVNRLNQADVNSEEFKKWFGNSKVVNEDGSPKVVYHGSISSFEAFNESDKGIYFTDNKDAAGSYGMYSEPYAVYLKAENPYILDFDGGVDTEETDTHYALEDEVKKAFEAGYDSVIAYNTFDGENELDQYIVKDPTQIKSINNNGQFDPENPNIYYQEAYHGSGADFNQFKNTMINSGQGSQNFGWGHYVSQSDLIGKDYAKFGEFSETQKQYNVSHAQDEYESTLKTIATYKELIPQIEAKEGDLYEDLIKRVERLSRWKQATYRSRPDEVKYWKNVEKNPQQYIQEKELPSIIEKIEKDEALLPFLKESIEKAKSKEVKRRNLYKVIIPDNTGLNYLDWDKIVPRKELNSIINLLKAKVAPEDVKYFDETYGLKYGETKGDSLYTVASTILGGDEQASQFFNENGYIGIIYDAGRNGGVPSGAEGARNYVIFNPNDIQIENHWIYDTDEEAQTFYQLDSATESSFLTEAKDFETKEEFIAFENSMAFGEAEFTEEELSDIWDRAHNIQKDTEGKKYVSPVDEFMSEDEKDNTFKAIMNTDEGVKNFIARGADAFGIRSDVNRHGGRIEVYSEEEYQEFMQAIQTADRIQTEAAPYITALMMRGQDISEDAIKKVRGMILNSVRDYRDLYSQIMGDENFAAGVYNEYLPNIKDSRSSGMRITQRKDLVKRLEGQEIIDAVKRGTEKYDGTAEKVIAVYEKEIADLNNKIQKLSEQSQSYYLKMTVEEKENFNKQQKIKKMESAITRERQNIRTKLDSGVRVSAEQLKRLNGWEDELNLLHEEVKQLRKQDRVNAALSKREALDALKNELKQKQKDKAAVEAVHRYKRELYNNIMKKPSANVDYSYIEKIKALQATMQDVSGYQNKTIQINGQTMKLDEFRAAIETGTIQIEGLSDYQLKRYLNTSLADLTIVDLETLSDTVSYYEKMGRQMWQAKVDKKNFDAERLRNQIYGQITSSEHYKPEDDNLAGSAASDKKLKEGLFTKGRIYKKSLNWARKAQMIDNGQKGLVYNLTVEERRLHQDEYLNGVRDRMNKVKDLMKQLGVAEEDFYQPVKIQFPDGKVEEFTAGKLAYAMLAEKNERNLYAVAFGNLVTQIEKENMPGTSNQVNKQIEKLGMSRYKALKAQAEYYFEQHPNLLKVVEEGIVADWNNPEVISRINKVLVEEYNKPMDVEGFYMTMHRQDFNGTESAYRLQDDMYNLNAGKSATTPAQGFKKSRIDISPEHQTPVDMDIYRVWADSVDDQENVIANVAYVRKLNRVFKNFGTRGVRSALVNAYGQAMEEDLNNYINEIANSSLFTDTQEINGIVNKLRGKLYPAYLGYKLSGIVLQGITSPMPFLQEVGPVELAKGLMQMSLHPVATWKKVCELSAYMENRSMNPAIDAIKKYASQYTDSKMKRAYDSFLEKGTWGLEAIDRWAVTSGWIACYEKKLAELGGETVENVKAAAHYADNVVRDTQPSGDVTEIAPLFKSKNAFAQAFTQFQVSLNVIWNNVTYDLPQSMKKHEYRKAVGLVFGYALAGILLQAVQNGFDDDDEPEDVAKKIIYGATTQFTQSFPLLGSLADSTMKTFITGENGWTMNTNQLYPGISLIGQGINTMMNKGLNKTAAKNLVKGASIMVGLPVSGAAELRQVFLKDDIFTSIEGGDFDFTFNPGAVLGRRNY